MPSKSKAQFGKIGLLFAKKKIGRKTLEEFNKGVDLSKLPEHVKPKKKIVKRKNTTKK